LHWKGGFALTKPEGWEWHRPLNPDLAFGRQLTDFDAFDQQVAIGDLVNLDDSHFPLITGYDPSRGHKISGAGSPEVDTIAPSFRVLFEEIRDNDVPLLDHVERDLEAFQEGLMGFELLSPIRLREVTGCDSAHYTSGYQYAHENIPEWIPIRERVVYVRGRWAIFSVRMCDYPAVDPGLLHDFDPFVEKLWFI